MNVSVAFMLLWLVVWTFGSSCVLAVGYDDRMLSNDIHNDITHMRLRALTSGKKPKNPFENDPLGPKNLGGVFSDDCNLHIGNNTVPQGLLSKPQTIVITGPVVNKCR